MSIHYPTMFSPSQTMPNRWQANPKGHKAQQYSPPQRSGYPKRQKQSKKDKCRPNTIWLTVPAPTNRLNFNAAVLGAAATFG